MRLKLRSPEDTATQKSEGLQKTRFGGGNASGMRNFQLEHCLLDFRCRQKTGLSVNFATPPSPKFTKRPGGVMRQAPFVNLVF